MHVYSDAYMVQHCNKQQAEFMSQRHTEFQLKHDSKHVQQLKNLCPKNCTRPNITNMDDGFV